MRYGIAAVVVVVILGAAGFYFYSQNQTNPESMMKKDEGMMESGDSMEKPDAMVKTGEGVAMDGVEVMEDKAGGDGMMKSQGGYTPFTQAAFDAASGKKRVLFFFANWCPTCKPIDAELSASTASIPAGVEIFRVNYNDTETDATDKELAAKHGITYQHTFVQVDDSGNEVAKWNGGGLEKIVSMVK